MSDELKDMNGTEENGQSVSEVPADEDAALAQELEQLRDTFQETLNETVAEAENEPVIQDLEIGEETPDEEDEEEHLIIGNAKKSKKKKKKKSKAGKVIIGVLIAIMLCIIIVLGAGLFITFKNPNAMTYFTNLAEAQTASAFDEKMQKYSDALECCKEENKMNQQMKVYVHELMINAIYEEKGLATAYSYIKQNIPEEETAGFSDKDVKKILKNGEQIKSVCETAIIAIVDAADENGKVDVDPFLTDITDESLKKEADDIIKNVTECLEKSAEAKTLGDYSKAGNAMIDALSKCSVFDIDVNDLVQKIAVSLYKKGYLYESLYVSANVLSDSQEGLTDEFNAIKLSAEDIKKLKVTPLALAEEFLDDYANITPEACHKFAEKKTKLNGANLNFIAQIIYDCAKVLEEYENKDFTNAAYNCTTALTAEKHIGIDDADLSFLYIKVMYALDVSSAYSMAENLITEETEAKLSEEQKKEYKSMQEVFEALAKTSEIFSTYYSSYYQSGTPVDFDAASKALDDYTKDNDSRFTRGFADYCKYFAKVCSADETGAIDYLLSAKKEIPEFLSLFVVNLVEQYLDNDDVENAVKTADEMLKLNKTHSYALSVKGRERRMNGDVDGILSVVLEAADAAGENNYCAREAGLAYLLKKDYSNAFKYLKIYFDSVSNTYYPSYPELMTAGELLYILDGIYKEDDDLKKDIAAAAADIETLYEYYQLTHLDQAKAVIEGKTTIEDIFTSGSYGFDVGSAPGQE